MLSALLLRVVRCRARAAGDALRGKVKLQATRRCWGRSRWWPGRSRARCRRSPANGVLALSPTRLLFRTSTGAAVDVPMQDVTAVRLQESFAGEAQPGRVHVVVSTVAGERAFLDDDGHRWRKAIDKARGGP